MTEDVVAQVVLRSPDGSSILEAPEPITEATIARYRVSAEVVQAASVMLEKLGFSVLAPGPTGFAIAGNSALFERIFDTILQKNVTRAPPALVPGPFRPSFMAIQPLSIPSELSSLVAAVVIPSPEELIH